MPATVPAAWTRIFAVDTAIRRALRLPATEPTRAGRLRALLTEQTRGLAVLQAGLDSIKQSLPETPPTLAIAPPDSGASAAPVAYALPPPRGPWAVVGLLETTPHWSILPTAPTGVVDQERTQASLTQSIQVQRQLGPGWRVRAGVGQAAVQTQARYTSELTRQTIVSNTTSKNDTTFHTGTRIVRIINTNTNDTTYQDVTTLDTLVTKTDIVRTDVVTQRDKLQQLLRPSYRFWTLPLSTQRVLLTRTRWNLAASAGAQLTLFRDAQRPVWTGEQYALRRVRVGETPYRPLSLSVSLGLEAQYRLTPRLSALVAPTLRWWAVPPGRGGATGRTLLPAAQVGLTWGL